MEPKIEENKYIISLQEKLDKCNKKLQTLEDASYILKDLALPKTSLYYLNVAVATLEAAKAKEPIKLVQDDLKKLIETLDKVTSHLLELEFGTAFAVLLDALFFNYTSAIASEPVLQALDKVIIGTAYNVALEQLIWEGNATVQ